MELCQRQRPFPRCQERLRFPYKKRRTRYNNSSRLPSHIILGEDFGLKKPSMVLLEQIQTVNKDELTDYIGSVNDERLWKQINAALKKTFGLWIYNTDRNGDVRCLCPKCLSDYIHDPNYVVRRLDPFAKSKDHCDKCNNSGWDYIVYDKRTSVKGKGCKNA